jgi:guanylate kinase
MSNDGPLLLIVSSPSGAGKTTLTSALRSNISGLVFSVSHTTRKPRQTELHGREYYFVARREFEQLIEKDTFLEWAEVHGNLYGTSRAEIERAQGSRGLIFDVDHQGARQIKSMRPDAVAVFILPPNMRILEQRLRGRMSEDDETVNRRYRAAIAEIQHYGLFDYVLVNDQLEDAVEKLGSIFRAEECRRQRAAKLAEALIADGRGYGGLRAPSQPPDKS